MISLHNAKSAGVAQLLGGYKTVADRADEAKVAITGKLRFTLEQTSDAEAWEGTDSYPVLPHLGHYYDLAVVPNNNAKWRLALSDDREFIVNVAKVAGEAGLKGSMVVKSVVAQLSKKSCVVDCTFVIGGVDPADVHDVAQWVRGHLNVETNNRQLDLYEEPDAKAVND